MEMNELIKAITAQGVMLDPEELQEFVRTGKKPTTFIDAGTLKDLDPSSPKYAAVQAILEIDDQIRDDAPPVTADPVVEKPVATQDSKPADTTSTTTPAAEVLDPELQLKLEDAYNQYIEEYGSEMSFDEFVRISPRAARIKAQFNKGKAQPAAAATPATTSTTTAVLQPNDSPLAQAQGTARTEPVVTQVSDKKADIEKTLYGTISGSIPLSQALPNGVYIDLGNGLFAYADKNEKIAAIVDRDNNYLVSKSFWNASTNKWQLPNQANLKDDAKKLGVDETTYIKKYQDAVDALNTKYNAELAALEGAKPAETTPEVDETEKPGPAEKTGSQKAQELIDSVSSIKDLPDLSKADSKPITIDLIELISTGQAKSKDITTMLAKRRGELLQNISPKDLQKGDIVTFVDGRKGFVKSVNNNEVSVKIAGSSQSVAEVIAAKDLSQKISNVEPGKAVSMEPTPDIEITPQDKKEVEASQDTKSAFTQNSAAVKQAGENAAKAAGTDNQQNLNNLLQNLGCKTK
jgi:hypothetical protein